MERIEGAEAALARPDLDVELEDCWLAARRDASEAARFPALLRAWEEAQIGHDQGKAA